MNYPQPTLCIGILTMNEARRIEQCIQSAKFANQLVVVDSGSKDDTVAIAEGLGAQVHIHADWQGFAEQRNRLLQYSTCDYIFFLDADEVITPELQSEIQVSFQWPTSHVGSFVEPSGLRKTFDADEVYWWRTTHVSHWQSGPF
jgi:glycosyltransferase involved in cell wall biosynthesis